MRLRGKIETAGRLAAALIDRTLDPAGASSARRPWRVIVGRSDLSRSIGWWRVPASRLASSLQRSFQRPQF